MHPIRWQKTCCKKGTHGSKIFILFVYVAVSYWKWKKRLLNLGLPWKIVRTGYDQSAFCFCLRRNSLHGLAVTTSPGTQYRLRWLLLSTIDTFIAWTSISWKSSKILGNRGHFAAVNNSWLDSNVFALIESLGYLCQFAVAFMEGS